MRLVRFVAPLTLAVAAASPAAPPSGRPKPRIVDASAPGAPITVLEVSTTRRVEPTAALPSGPAIDASRKAEIDRGRAADKPPIGDDDGAPPLGVAPPANDLCTSPMVVSLPFNLTENTACATTSPTDPNPCGAAQNSHSVWFSVTPAQSGTLQIDTCGSAYDTVLSLYTGTCGGVLSAVGCNDDSCALQSRVSVPAASGTTYLVQIQQYAAGAGGNLVVNGVVAQPLANDSCQSPTQLPNFGPFPILRTQDTTLATTDPNDPVQACSAGGAQQNGNSVWFTWTTPLDGTVTLDSCASTYDTVVSIFTGTCGSFTELACNDDRVTAPGAPTCPNGLSSWVQATLPAATTVSIEVTDWGVPGGGNLSLTLDFRATPDPSANSAPVVEDGWTARFRNLLGLSRESEDYAFNPDVNPQSVDGEDLAIVQRFTVPKEGYPAGVAADYFFVNANPATAANPTGEDLTNPPAPDRVPVVVLDDVFFGPEMFPPASVPYTATVAVVFNGASSLFPATPGPTGERRYDWFSIVEFSPTGPFADGLPADLNGNGDLDVGVVFRNESGSRNLFRLTSRTDDHGAEVTDFVVNRTRRGLQRLNVLEAHPPLPQRDFPNAAAGENALTRPWSFVLH
jgi:hypothetical protein